jgi:hypothetical protein
MVADGFEGMPDVWDPVERVGRLELDRDIPGYKEFPDCQYSHSLISKYHAGHL